MSFLIDGSGSINAYGRGNFRRCLDFVKRLVASFSISPTHTRVGIVLFSNHAWLIANFRKYRNKQSLLHAIDRIRYPRGGTKIGRALRFAKHRLFRKRTNRRKVGINDVFPVGFPYQNNRGAPRTRTKILFCGRGLNFVYPSEVPNSRVGLLRRNTL